MGYRIRMVAEVAGWLRSQYANVRSEEERLTVASRRLQHKVNDFRTRKEAAMAAEAAAEAAAQAAEAEAAIEGVIAGAEGPGLPSLVSPSPPGRPGTPGWLPLSELRPGSSSRILFTVEPSGPGTEPSGTAVLLAAGTERDWLEAWYAEAILRCRTRYERDQGGTG